jgi:hypothetical protein
VPGKKIVMRCNHCENMTSFTVLSTHTHKAYDWITPHGRVVYNTTWQFLECQTCSRPTLVESVEWCTVYDDGEDGLGRLSPGLPKHGEEVNCEDIGDDEVVYPVFIPSPAPSKDMPDDIAKDFNEARAVFAASPRASAALLRLAIQKLCIHLGEKGENLNDDIGALVQKGLSVQVQQALDSVRVIGNNAVHPAKIDFEDNAEVAGKLFELVNFIVRETITRPREIAELYNKLPERTRSHIQARQSRLGRERSSK